MEMKFFILLVIACKAWGQTLDNSQLKSISLTNTPLTVTPVTLTCEAELVHGINAREITIRRLTPSGFVWFAKINFQSGVQTNNVSSTFNGVDIFNNMHVSGHLAKGSGTSKIQVSWPKLDEQKTFGKYRCDLVYEQFYIFKYGESDPIETGSIDELMDKIKSMSQNVANGALVSQIDTLRKRISGLSSDVGTLTTASANNALLLQRIDALSKQIKFIESSTEEASSNSGSITELQKEFTSIKKSATETSDLIDKVTKLNLQVTELQKSENSLKELQSKFQTANQEISSLRVQSANADKLNARFNELLQRVSTIQSVSRSEFNEYNIRSLVWPQGSFSLLMPRTGCPRNTVTPWARGTRIHYTETSSGNNQNSNSTENHMPKNLFTVKDGKYLATLNYCTHLVQKPGAVNWPKGSYCINRKRRCPTGFHQGTLTIDDEDVIRGPQINKRTGVTPDGRYNSNTQYIYCCRDDASAGTKMFLPVSQPFYLYRYRGQCQEVYGMDVTNDHIVLDTANDDPGRRGKNIDKRTGAVPDGAKNNTRIELCYYKQRV